MLNYRKHNLWRAFMIFFSIMMKTLLLLKNIPTSRLGYKNHTLLMTKMAKFSYIIYPIYDQNGLKAWYPLEPHIHINIIHVYLAKANIPEVTCLTIFSIVIRSMLHRKRGAISWGIKNHARCERRTKGDVFQNIFSCVALGFAETLR